ncbi:hypothetical protein D3C77_458270 [compost metagenome]
MDDGRQGRQAADVVEVVLGHARRRIDEQIARAPAAVEIQAEAVDVGAQGARVDIGVAVGPGQAEAQGLGPRLQGDAHAIAVGRGLADRAARIGLGLVRQGPD